LAQLGHRVCLIERHSVSRRPASETLSSSIRGLLEQLGLWERIEHLGFLQCDRMQVRWRDEATLQGNDAFIVDRARFDRTLREAAAQAGVTVLCPARARRPARLGERWVIPIDSPEGSSAVEARFFVDASGRRGGCRPAGVPTIALCGRWHGAVSTAPVEMRIDVSEHAWCWAVPVSRDCAVAQVFVDPQSCALGDAAERATLYHTLLDRSRLLREFLRGLSLAELRVRDATYRVDDNAVTPNSIKVGDRALAMDPLSSQGVQAAIRSGLQASAVINTILRGGDTDVALEFYRTSQQEVAKAHDRHASGIYASQGLYSSSFWQSRSNRRSVARERAAPSIKMSENPDLKLSQHASLVAFPVIEGDRIRRRTALAHPGLERPIAWLGGVPLGPALSAINPGRPAASILAEWSQFATPAQARAVLDWMIDHEILVSA
jgi:flavin-dependent dehydrogenase